MSYEYIEPFVDSAIKVMDRVLQSDIARGGHSIVGKNNINGEVAVIIGFRDYSDGMVILTMDRETAIRVCSIMNGEKITSLTSLAVDSISELANMIAGNAASMLNDMDIDFEIYPPIVVKEGTGCTIPAVEAFQVPLYTECGEIVLNIGARNN